MKFSLNTGGKFNTGDVNNTGKYNLNSNTDIIDFDYHETNWLLCFKQEENSKMEFYSWLAL
jgi:hypothetical protein